MTSIRLEQYRLASNPDFQGIVEAAVMVAANEVLDESLGTPGHEQRAALARTFMLTDAANRPALLQQFVWQVALNADIRLKGKGGLDKIDDAPVDAMVREHWDAIAGTPSIAEPDPSPAPEPNPAFVAPAATGAQP